MKGRYDMSIFKYEPKVHSVPPGFALVTRNGQHILIPDSTAEVIEQERNSINLFGEPDAAELALMAPDWDEFDPAETDPEPPLENRLVQVFEPGAVEAARSKARHAEADARPRLKYALDRAAENNGRRNVPRLHAQSIAGFAAGRFPNFRESVDALFEDLAIADAMPADDFRIAPMLLNGVPGIGKTAFAQSLAAGLGVPFRKVSAGGLQTSAQFVGTAAHWANAQTGMVFDMLASGEDAVGVLLIDEIDKIPHDQHRPVLPALLDLLEPETAGQFVDESIPLAFDARRLIVLMASNCIEAIDKTLLSRCSVFDIEEPSVEQKYAIAYRIFADLTAKAKRPDIDLDRGSAMKAAESGCDLREISRATRRAFARALIDGKKRAKIEVVAPATKQRIGF